LPQLETLLADDWGADIHRRLREYALNVLGDLKAGRFETGDRKNALAHLNQLGTDLALHQTLAKELGSGWTAALVEVERGAMRLRDVIQAAA